MFIVDSLTKEFVMESEASRIIDVLGGPVKVAKLCPPIGSQAVSVWRKNGIPAGWNMYLKLRFRKKLREAGIL
jgi:hypothetical protein